MMEEYILLTSYEFFTGRELINYLNNFAHVMMKLHI